MNIFENPFYILGVSPRDNRRAIAAAAEDKLFLSDAAVINDARNALLIPEKRLAAEMRWFPGIDDRKIAELIEFLLQLRAGKDQNSNLADLTDYIDIDALNLLIYIWEFKSASDITAVIFEISKFFEDMYVDDILVTINEARAEAGFPEAGEAEVEYELNNYRADIVKTIEDKLSALALEEYYDVINSLAEKYAEGDGDYYNSLLLGDLLDDYELNITSRIEEKRDLILSALDNMRRQVNNISNNDFENLSLRLKEWHDMARPLELAAQVRGINNKNLDRQVDAILDVIVICDGELANIINSSTSSIDDKYSAICNTLELAQLVRKYFHDIAYFTAQHIEDLKVIQAQLDAQLKERDQASDLEAMLTIIKDAVIKDLQELPVNLNLDKLAEHIKLWHSYAMTLIFMTRYIEPEDQAAEIYGAALSAAGEILSQNPGKPDMLQHVIKLMYFVKAYLSDISKSIADDINQNIIKLEAAAKIAADKNNISRISKQGLKDVILSVGIIMIVLLFAVMYSVSSDNKNSPAPAKHSASSARYDRRVELKTQLQELKPKIESAEANIKTMSTELDRMKIVIGAHRAIYERQHKESDRLSLNSEIDKYNNYLAAYNAQIELYKQDVKKYNSMVDEYNSLRY